MNPKDLNYSRAYAELESILQKLENQELDLDQLSENVKRASELIKFCKAKLHDTEEEIEKVLKGMDQPE